MHGYKTFVLCLAALGLYFVGGYLTGVAGTVVENAEWVILAVASLYAGNDVAGAVRDRARRIGNDHRRPDGVSPDQEAA